MVRGTSYMFVTGPNVVKTVTHEDVTMEELGGADTHAAKSGVAHFACDSETECLQHIRDLFRFIPSNNLSDPPRGPATNGTEWHPTTSSWQRLWLNFLPNLPITDNLHGMNRFLIPLIVLILVGMQSIGCSAQKKDKASKSDKYLPIGTWKHSHEEDQKQQFRLENLSPVQF